MEDFYELGQTLGEGKYGTVKSCLPLRREGNLEPGRMVACKSIKWEKIQTATECRALRTEIELMDSLRGHPQIVNLEHVHRDEAGVHIFMEMCEGDLFSELKRRGSFPENEVKSIFLQLAQAVAILHKKGIVHRDLKLDNVLLTKQFGRSQTWSSVSTSSSPPSESSSVCSSVADLDMEWNFSGSVPSSEIICDMTSGKRLVDSAAMHVKLADFGLATFSSSIRCSEIAGSPFYLSPEVLKLIIVQQSGAASRSSLKPYGTAMDVWSMGVILYSLFTGRFPFSGQTPIDLYRSIKNVSLNLDGDAFSHVSMEARALIKKLLAEDAQCRPSMQEVLADPWFGSAAAAHVADPVSARMQLLSVKEVCGYLSELEQVKPCHPAGTASCSGFPVNSPLEGTNEAPMKSGRSKQVTVKEPAKGLWLRFLNKAQLA